MNYDVSKLGLSEEELFAQVEHNDTDSEKIAAPRYSYWQSVFRVLFKKKIRRYQNIYSFMAQLLPFSDLS